ncbi:MAG: 4-aminobutyrate--2-oxoglutarate transaminase, partial [Actinomycetota bacterium]
MSATIPQKRNLVTAIPGPKSQELQKKKLKEVSAGVGTMLPVYIEKAHGAILVDVDGNSLI